MDDNYVVASWPTLEHQRFFRVKLVNRAGNCFGLSDEHSKVRGHPRAVTTTWGSAPVELTKRLQTIVSYLMTIKPEQLGVCLDLLQLHHHLLSRAAVRRA
ncbi:hypothetical protein TKK_0007582 [Trichogramma kaykai]